MARNIKVLIAEDHDVVREGLKILIGSDPGLQITGEARNGRAAVRLAKTLRPDVVLMDLSMPCGSGLEASRRIARDVPRARVLILSAHQDDDTVQRVVASGVAGYLTKHSAADELLTAIREVGRGNAYYSPKIADKINAHLRQTSRAVRQPGSGNLTPREREVLVLIATGQPNKQIAFTLGLSIKTIEKHRQATMDKLNIHDIPGLTRYAMAKGLLTAAGDSPVRMR
jgi:DNA-binding NarL/FixJ family response regulator